MVTGAGVVSHVNKIGSGSGGGIHGMGLVSCGETLEEVGGRLVAVVLAEILMNNGNNGII